MSRWPALEWSPGAAGRLLRLACDDDDEPCWQDLGACAEVDGDLFFPDKGGSTREAKTICAGCEVRAECLEYAMETDQRFGVWGGLSERERRRLGRRAAAA